LHKNYPNGSNKIRVETIGPCTLYLGDCLEILPEIGNADAVVTDPPYGINAGKMKLGFSRTSKMEKSAWDKKAPDLTLLLNMDKPSIIWGGNYFSLPIQKGWLVWDKGNGFKGRSFSECELAWTNLPINAKTFLYNPLAKGDYRKKEHPVQKPVKVMTWCLSFIPSSNVILDPFMGSGTTGVACVNTGRRFIGIEIEGKYFDAACKRIEQAVKQGRFEFEEAEY
jgi:DNA modification methylase